MQANSKQAPAQNFTSKERLIERLSSIFGTAIYVKVGPIAKPQTVIAPHADRRIQNLKHRN